MRVLVTGGAGFIGSYVLETLDARGHTATVFDRTRGRDVRDQHTVWRAMVGVDAVIHLAGILGTQETFADPREAFETNVLGSLNVFTAAAGRPVVYITVGNWWMDNPYSISKSCAERVARMFNAERDGHISIVRTMNAYGPRQPAPAPYGPAKIRKVIPTFISQACAGVPLEVYGDGTQIMDMVYATDVADTLVDALASPVEIECGSGVPTTVNDIARAVIDEVGGGTIVHLPMRPGETPHATVLADNQPSRVALADGLTSTVAWFRSLA